MKKLTDFLVDHKMFVLSFFLVLTGISLLLSSKVEINRDITKYLPKSSETRQGMDIMEREFKELKTSSLNIMFHGLEEQEKITIYEELKKMDGVKEVEYENTDQYNQGDDTLYVLTASDTKDSVLASELYDQLLSQYQDYDIEMSGDIVEENKDILPLWIIALAIFCGMIILILMCDSYLEPFLFLIAIGIAIALNKGTNIFFSSVSSITNSITAILQLALSMDYSIMLMNRYRQEKEKTKEDTLAMKRALYASVRSISSSSVTTIVGLLALVFMSFTLGKDLGFVLAKGVLFSLVTVFTCLPAFILLFDKWIVKTKKKSPVFHLDGLGKFAYHARHVGILVFIILFVASYFLKGNLGILYTDVDNDAVGKVFQTNNQMAFIYPNQYEEKVSAYCHQLEKNDKIDDVLCYGNTIGEPLPYSALNQKFKDLGTDTQVEDYLLRIAYYHYFEKEENNQMSLVDFITFIKNDVYQQETMSKHIDDDMKKNVDKLENFVQADLMNQKRTEQEVASMFDIPFDSVHQLLIYNHSLSSQTKLSLVEFVDFMNSYLLKSEYATSLSSNQRKDLETLTRFTNPKNRTKKSSKEISKLLGLKEQEVEKIYLYQFLGQDTKTKLTLYDFATFVEEEVFPNPEYASFMTKDSKQQIALLKKWSDSDQILKKMDETEMADMVGVDVSMIQLLYQLFDLYHPEEVSNHQLTPYEFVGFLVETPTIRSFLSEEQFNSLSLAYQFMSRASTAYSVTELSSMLKLEPSMVKLVYRLYDWKDASVKMTPLAFVEFLLQNQNDEPIRSSLTEENIKQLTYLQKVMKSVEKNTRYTSSSLADFLGMDASTMSLLYAVYDVDYQKKSVTMSYREFVTFLLEKVVNQEPYASQFDADKKEKLKTIDTIMTSSLQKKLYDKEEMYQTLSKLAHLDKNLIDLLYMYYGSQYDYQTSWQMPIEEFVRYLNEDILKDSRFDDFLEEDRRQEIIDAKQTVTDAKELLTSQKYSRMVLNTTYDLEGEETFSFIQEMKDDLKLEDSYFIGNSPMAYDMSHTFQSELNFITILTILFIFVVVALTFRSLLIPTILVILIQTAVYVTMGILSFQGGTVYFIALLIVQSILMGATIDYAILYTSYYLEFRRKQDRKEAMISSYNQSIHTILTSASILSLVTLVVGYFGSAITAKICTTISQGTICSTLLILFLLPELLASFDKWIIKKNEKEKNT